MLYDLNKKNNLLRNNFIHRDQQLGAIIGRDPLNLRFDPLNIHRDLRDPLQPLPGQPGPLGPLGKPTGRW